MVAELRSPARTGIPPHVPQTVGLRLVRELYATDLVQLTLSPSGAPAMKHLAEVLVLARLPQLPPAQKMVLARRGTARIAGVLLVDGQPEVVGIVLESPFLNEGQVLRVLSRINLSARVIGAIASSGRWTQRYSVRLALVRNPRTPIATVLSNVRPGLGRRFCRSRIHHAHKKRRGPCGQSPRNYSDSPDLHAEDFGRASVSFRTELDVTGSFSALPTHNSAGHTGGNLREKFEAAHEVANPRSRTAKRLRAAHPYDLDDHSFSSLRRVGCCAAICNRTSKRQLETHPRFTCTSGNRNRASTRL
jgi:hypothetical protein